MGFLCFYLILFLFDALQANAIYHKWLKSESSAKKIIMIIMAAFPTTAVSAVRWNVGKDFENYRVIFNIVSRGVRIKITTLEPLYVALNWVVSILHGNFIVIVVVTSILYGVFIKQGIFLLSKQENIRNVVFVVYVCNTLMYAMSLNAIRQAIAVSIVCIGVYFYRDGKLNVFIACVTIAVLFQYTAIIALVVIILNKSYIHRKKELSMGLLLLIFAYVISSPEVLSALVNNIAILEKYRVHLSYKVNYSLIKNLIGYLPLYAGIVFYKKCGNEKNSFFYNCGIATLIFLLLGTNFAYMFRMVYYLYIFDILLAHKISEYIRPNSLYKIVTACAMTYLFIHNCYFLGNDAIFPYVTIWGG